MGQLPISPYQNLLQSMTFQLTEMRLDVIINVICEKTLQKNMTFLISLLGSKFFGKTPLFFRYSGVKATNTANLLAKRR